ncbi:MAG: hypothetical protein QOE93_313, partial [Actinomycetota bacterium]|nr:hypothetical protein [Actinomycetota bacterium]
MTPSGPDLGIRGITDPVEVGRGGFAIVYRAYQPAFDRYVAVKVIEVSRPGEAVQRDFRRECAAIGRLSGRANILTVYDAGVTDSDQPYLTMEYCARGS